MLEIGTAIDVGLKRRGKENEDYIGTVLPDKNQTKPPLLVVADGMGGYLGGTLASRIVVDTLIDYYRKSPVSISKESVLTSAIREAHQKIRKRASNELKVSQMGSTIVALILDIESNKIFMANVGDSRAYLVDSNEIIQISWDHSQVGEEVRQGKITTTQARMHPRRNMLTMSINAQRKDIDIYYCERIIKPGDCVVLCSDGLWGSVTDAQIHAVVSEMDPQRAAEKLLSMANTNQGPDNISVIVARV